MRAQHAERARPQELILAASFRLVAATGWYFLRSHVRKRCCPVLFGVPSAVKLHV